MSETKTYNIASNSDTTYRGFGNAIARFYGPATPNLPVGYLDNYGGGEAQKYQVYESSFLFKSIDIPRGSTITNAKINIKEWYLAASIGSRSTDIQACDEDDSVIISSFSDFGSRARTTSNINWTGALSADVAYDTPDIKTVIQEIISRAGWSNGNDLQIIFSDHSYKYPNYPSPGTDSFAIALTLDSSYNISLEITYDAPTRRTTGQLPMFFKVA